MARKLAIDEFFAEKKEIIFLSPKESCLKNKKAFLSLVGAEISQQIKVWDFNKMAKVILNDLLITQNLKTVLSKDLDEDSRNIFMYMAIKRNKKKLKLYKNYSNFSKTIYQMVCLEKELTKSNVGFKLLFEKIKFIKNKILQEKIREIAFIVSSFKSIVSEHNNRDYLNNLDLLFEFSIFKQVFNKYIVFIDGFDFFTNQELKIIKSIIKQSQKCYISLCADFESCCKDYDETSVFVPIYKTINKLISIANNCEVKVLKPIFLKMPNNFKNDNLRFLEQNIFSNYSAFKEDNVQNTIKIYAAQDIYDECDFVARTIKKLIMNENFKYKDFIIITRDIKNYEIFIISALLKYKIPFFIDIKKNICLHPIIRLILTAFEVVHSNFSYNSVIEFIKTDFLKLPQESVCLFENYAFTWQISDQEWFEDFKSNPSGMKQLKDSDKEKLKIINNVRRSFIEPLIKFYRAVKNSEDVEIISLGVFNLLSDFNVFEFFKALKSKTFDGLRVFDLVIKALDKIVDLLKNDKISSKDYVELFNLVISCNDENLTFKKADQVMVKTVDKIHLENRFVAFIVGANSAKFPKEPQMTGMFLQKEIEELNKIDIPIKKSMEEILSIERFWSYRALTCAKEKIFISFYERELSSKEVFCSEIVGEVKNIFTDLNIVFSEDEEIEEKVWEENLALELLSKYKNKVLFTKSFKNCLNEKTLLKIKNLEKQNFLKFKENSFKNLFNTPMILSVTQIEQYNLCSFKYLCEYGFFIKPQKQMLLDNLEYGNLAHFIMEKIFKNYSIEELLNEDESLIFNKISLFFNKYVDSRFSLKILKSAQFKFLSNRWKKFLHIIVINVLNEFSQSKFRPIGCELVLSYDSKKKLTKPLKIMLNKKTVVCVEGKIDRLDLMETKEGKYFRVIDYKISKKDLNLSDLTQGLNMQTLIYLAAILQQSSRDDEKFLPAGVSYVNLCVPVIDGRRDFKIKKIFQQGLQKSGLILNDRKIINEIQKDTDNIFTSGKRISGHITVTNEEMDTILKFVENEILNVFKKIELLNFKTNPAVVNSRIACEFCEYFPICFYKKGTNDRKIKKFKYDDVIRILKLKLSNIKS
jgi:ATP-dependent helicase/nuclease subunit B